MNKEEYNRLSIPYQFLTRRFYDRQTYHYEGFYKCFNPEHYIVKGEHLEVLQNFTDLSFREIYTEEHIQEHYFGDEYLNSKLVKIEEKKVCINSELGQVFLYLLVSKLQKGIEQYLNLIADLQNEYKGLVRTKEDGNIVEARIYLLDDLKHRFEEIENYPLVFHLLAQTNSGFLTRDRYDIVEINLRKIKGLLKTVKYFDFSKVEL
ncbi:hypothetical protein [Psychroflexus sp. MBR-150]|jgi:hypothetical protein